MKKIVIVSFLLVSIMVVLSGCDKFSKIGTEKYYVKIVGNGEKIDNYYRYKEIPAYNEDGQKILVNINTFGSKELKKDAYLQVDVKAPSTKEANEIKGFEEVVLSQIPEKAKKELK